MGWIKAIQGFFGAINAYFRAAERKENETAGINKMKVAQNDEFEKNRKAAKDIGSRKHTSIKSSGKRRN